MTSSPIVIGLRKDLIKLRLPAKYYTSVQA
jgi:hypothetical protein